MPKNRHALIRYKTIDACLRRTTKRWTLLDLQMACQDALSEAKGESASVSLRQISRDLGHMRRDFSAPIEVEDRKFYFYADPNFSIEKGNLNEYDLILLQEISSILAPFHEFSQVERLQELIQKIGDTLHLNEIDIQDRIQFERVESVPGRQFLSRIYRAILAEQTLSIGYQSFRNPELLTWQLSPWLLKEYNNRWYILGMDHEGKRHLIVALDRIQWLKPGEVTYLQPKGIDLTRYFDDRIGVSGGWSDGTISVVLTFVPEQAPYLKSRPLHRTQRIISEDGNGLTVSLSVRWNYELEARILSFGEGVEVISPDELKQKIYRRIQTLAGRYIR